MMYEVMIVDDERLMGESLRQMVDAVAGFKATYYAQSGEEALAVLEERSFDLIFLDIFMPGISGITVCQEIRERRLRSDVIIISAFSDPAFIEENLGGMISDYLPKPISARTIEKCLTRYKESHPGIERDLQKKLRAQLATRDYAKMCTAVAEVLGEIDAREQGDGAKIDRGLRELQRSLRFDLERDSAVEGFTVGDYHRGEEILWALLLEKTMDQLYQKAAVHSHPKLAPVFAYIDDHLAAELGLGAITENCHISQTYLSMLFKQELGVSVMEYIHLRKIAKAKLIFATTEDSMVDVAYQLGYNESTYFSKIFKKYEGITIKEYKRRMK